MPVNELIVEGKLDAEILNAVFTGKPLIVRGGSKNSLAPQAIRKREDTNQTVCYLRDRDFDYDPPEDVNCPVVDRRHNEEAALGWHWCRHEIENYLIDPKIVTAAIGWCEREYVETVVKAAKRIRHYQIARWVIGTSRRTLPPHYELRTKPEEFENCDFRLPKLLTETDTSCWAREQVSDFFDRVSGALGREAVESELKKRSEAITESFLEAVDHVLLWCSGKDILAAIEPWLQKQYKLDAGIFRAKLRDWVRSHPQEALKSLPEWSALVKLVAK